MRITLLLLLPSDLSGKGADLELGALAGGGRHRIDQCLRMCNDTWAGGGSWALF